MLSFPAETNYNLEGTDKIHNWSELITESVFWRNNGDVEEWWRAKRGKCLTVTRRSMLYGKGCILMLILTN